MLMTNIAVAQQVAVHFSEQAMLRRHDSPIDRRMVGSLWICLPMAMLECSAVENHSRIRADVVSDCFALGMARQSQFSSRTVIMRHLAKLILN